MLARIPLDRVLPETDHPFGDKGRAPRRPGEVGHVEAALAEARGLSTEEIRVLADPSVHRSRNPNRPTAPRAGQTSAAAVVVLVPTGGLQYLLSMATENF